MAIIPVIPGVQVATKGILNKSLKDIICALLFGGLANMLKGPLLCIQADLDKLITENTGLPGIKDLQNELKELKNELKAAEDLAGIKDTLNRINGAIAEVQSLLALDGLCKIPMRAPKIPDVLGQIIDAEFAEMNAILRDIGRLAKPQVCLNGDGGINTGSYNPESILGSIQKHGGRMADIPGQKVNGLINRVKGIRTALNKSINRQLFPDFRHKTNLVTGKPYVPGQTFAQAGLVPAGASNANTPVPVITMAPPPPLANQWNGPYPPSETPNLKEATNQANAIVGNVRKTASYPVKTDGIVTTNIWPGLVGPEVYALAVTALTPQDPFFAQQDPIYDYCGKLIGYESTVITGDPADDVGDPILDAELNPPVTNFNFVWIQDRQCWGVTGVQSEQIINGRKDTYLDANPIVQLKRGYSHTFGVPSADIGGFVVDGETVDPASIAPEFYICYVDADLTPRIQDGKVVKFNLGLSRLETFELLEDANGIAGSEGLERRLNNPLGTNIYFQAENKVYTGEEPPNAPNEEVWWFHPITCITKRWVLNRYTDASDPDTFGDVIDGSGQWIEVTQQERDSQWFGSSNVVNDPHVNYLAYSNEDGTIFGLLKFV